MRAEGPIPVSLFFTCLADAFSPGVCSATVEVLESSLGVNAGELTLWGYSAPIDGPGGSFTPTTPAGDTIQGTLSVPLHLGTDRDTTAPFTAVFDVTLDEFLFPLEGTCL